MQERLLKEQLFAFPIMLDSCRFTPSEVRAGTFAPLAIGLGKRFHDWELLRKVLSEARTPFLLCFGDSTEGVVDEVDDERLKRLLRDVEKCWGVVLCDGTRITREGLEFLATKPSLKRLKMDGCNIGDDDVDVLKHSAVTFYQFDNTRITGTCFSEEWTTPLARINLGNCPLSDEGIEHISRIPSLEILSLEYSDDLLSRLAPLYAQDCGIKHIVIIINEEERQSLMASGMEFSSKIVFMPY